MFLYRGVFIWIKTALIDFRMVLWEYGVQDILNNENDKLWNLN